jgi:hypothetical protein
MFTIRNVGGAALFLFGTTFLWLTPSFASPGVSTTGAAWSMTQVLALVTLALFTAATWGLFKKARWWKLDGSAYGDRADVRVPARPALDVSQHAPDGLSVGSDLDLARAIHRGLLVGLHSSSSSSESPALACGSAPHDLVQGGVGAVLDRGGRLPEPGLADGRLERLGAFVAADVDEAEVSVRREAAV